MNIRAILLSNVSVAKDAYDAALFAAFFDTEAATVREALGALDASQNAISKFDESNIDILSGGVLAVTYSDKSVEAIVLVDKSAQRRGQVFIVLDPATMECVQFADGVGHVHSVAYTK